MSSTIKPLDASLYGQNLPLRGKGRLLDGQPVALSDAVSPGQGGESGVTVGKDVEKAATDFEALLLQQMFSSMWSTVPQSGFLSGSREEELFRDMLNEALAKSVAENASIGIKDVIVRDMKKLEEK